MSERAESVPDFESSTYAPAVSADALTKWWERDVPGRTAIYLPFKVRVLSVEMRDGLRVLKFILARQEGQPSPPEFKVTLPTDPDVWPDLPSTAQFVEPGRTPPYGFLFIKKDWAMEQKVDIATLAESTGGTQKWPLAGFGRPDGDPDVDRVIKAMGNREVRAKLLQSLDAILRSTP